MSSEPMKRYMVLVPVEIGAVDEVAALKEAIAEVAVCIAVRRSSCGEPPSRPRVVKKGKESRGKVVVGASWEG